MPTGEIAAALGKHQTQLSRVRASLITEHHLLRAADYGHVEFAFPRFAGPAAQRSWRAVIFPTREKR